jgi:hypothetical protein
MTAFFIELCRTSWQISVRCSTVETLGSLTKTTMHTFHMIVSTEPYTLRNTVNKIISYYKYPTKKYFKQPWSKRKKCIKASTGTAVLPRHISTLMYKVKMAIDGIWK